MIKEVIAERLTLIGVGLIGGSLARDLKQAGAVGEVVATAKTKKTLHTALDLGVIDRAESTVEAAVDDAGVVVIATPMQAMPQVLAALNGCVSEKAVLTDVGSVKQYALDAASAHLPQHISRFVPGHPIAGTENSGVAASQPNLFQDKTVILTPTAETSRGAADLVARMWRTTGAHIRTLDAKVHDNLLAATSHLPHVVAYALVDFLAQREDSEQLFELAAGGFYDFTRIASSDPVMWRDICLTNRVSVLRAIKGYRAYIDQMINAIETGDSDALLESFRRSKQSRDGALRRSGRRKT